MQPESSLSTLTEGPAPAPGAPSDPASAPKPEPETAPHPPHHVPRWLERTELFLRVLLRMYVGLAALFVPWWHSVWDPNPLFLRFPSLGDFATLGAVRGIVSGLGLLNLWIAFQNVISRKDSE
jgi:hypothetical protein